MCKKYSFNRENMGNTTSDRNYEKMSNLYISAETYLYGCEKEGVALDCALGMQCYEQIKQSIDKWLEINNPFMPTFWE